MNYEKYNFYLYEKVCNICGKLKLTIKNNSWVCPNMKNGGIYSYFLYNDYYFKTLKNINKK